MQMVLVAIRPCSMRSSICQSPADDSAIIPWHVHSSPAVHLQRFSPRPGSFSIGAKPRAGTKRVRLRPQNEDTAFLKKAGLILKRCGCLMQPAIQGLADAIVG